MVASAFAGMVTAESSSHSQAVMRQPPVSMMENSMVRKPMDNPRTRPALISVHARSMSSETPRDTVATTSMPFLVTFASVTRSEEHTSELQSLMRISYAVFCLKKNNNDTQYINRQLIHTST